MDWKPEGQTSVAPYLIVPDAAAQAAFLRAVFGAEVLEARRHAGGGIRHMTLRLDDSTVMIGQAPDGPEAHVHVWVPDPAAAHRTALAAGAEDVQPPRDTAEGDTRAGVRLGGITWWMSRHRG